MFEGKIYSKPNENLQEETCQNKGGSSSNFFASSQKKRKRENYNEVNKRKSNTVLNEVALTEAKEWIDAMCIGLNDNQKLLVAAQSGLIEVCTVLVERISNIDCVDEVSGKTALYSAVEERLKVLHSHTAYDEIIELLISKGARPDKLCTISEDLEETTEGLINRKAQSESDKLHLSELLEGELISSCKQLSC